MSSSALELSVLKLTSPRKRLGQSGRFSFDTSDPALQNGTCNSSFSPRGKTAGGNGGVAPWFADDDLFTIFEQHQPRAAIPFKWEESPGTRRDQKLFKDAEASKVLKKAMSFTETQSSKDGMSDSEEQDNSSTSSPTFSLSPSGSTNSTTSSSSRSSVSLPDEPQHVGAQSNAAKFQVNPIQIPPKTFTADDGSGDEGNQDGLDKNSVNENAKLAHEPVIGKSGQILPLKPPPGMHSIKQLLSLETEDRSFAMSCFSTRSINNLISSGTASNCSAITNLKSNQRRSFRRDGLKALPFVSSASKSQRDDFLKNMLGMEEWSKVVKKQEKQEKHQQQEETTQIRGHHRTLSMPRLPFAFKKKSTTETDSGSTDTLDADTFFNEDFGKQGGLRESRPLSSVSSRSFSDLHKLSKGKSWVFDNDAEYSDDETDTLDSCFFDSQTIAEEGEKEQLQTIAKNHDVSVSISQDGAKEKRKSDALSRLRRIFHISSRSSNGDRYRISQNKPARLSSVSPAPPPLAPTQSELRLKRVPQNNQVDTVSSSPILKICSALPFGNAILKNVRQLRSFEFHSARALTSK